MFKDSGMKSLHALKQDRVYHIISLSLFSAAQVASVGFLIYDIVTGKRDFTLLNSAAFVVIVSVILLWIRIVRRINLNIKNYDVNVQMDNTVEIITPVDRECHTDGKVNDVNMGE